MKKGFTLLEVLVASLLMGMLVTILTMIFNQSSIAWRTGVAGVADLDEARGNMAELRDEADNVYVWNNKPQRLLGLWNEQGKLRTRAVDAEGGDFETKETAQYLKAKANASFSDNMRLNEMQTVPVGSGDSGNGFNTYIVNVKSAGPDGELGTWDDIWSYPDDFD